MTEEDIVQGWLEQWGDLGVLMGEEFGGVACATSPHSENRQIPRGWA